MQRRTFVATAGCLVCGGLAGCSGTDAPEAAAEIGFLELENHRREDGHEFAVRIERGDETVFEAAPRLQPNGSGDAAVAFEDPVKGPGAYAVSVEVDDHSTTVETADLVSEEEPCLGLRFYLDQRELRTEHRTFQRCD